MPKPFRSAISTKSIDELKARMGMANHDQPPSAPQDTLNPILMALIIILASYWFVLIVAMPVLLLLLVFGVGDWTVEWLWAAGYGVIGLALFGVGFTCFALAAAWDDPEERWKHLRELLGIFGGALLVILLVALFAGPLDSPPSRFDQVRLVGAGASFILLSGWHMLKDLRKRGYSFRSYMRLISICALNVAVTIFVIDRAFEPTFLESELAKGVRLMMTAVGLVLYNLFPTDVTPAPRQPATQVSTHIVVLGGLGLFVMLILAQAFFGVR